MCGIAGISSGGGTDPARLEDAMRRMVAAMRHRGPDAEGIARLGGETPGAPVAFIANTRLAILDLSPTGLQPMRDPESGDAVVLNGEIYNHMEPRAELGASLPWRSSGDTETVLRALGKWGTGALPRLRGMFAFAYWRAATGDLWIARDRLGIKPLYYARVGDTMLFASEVRALLASGMLQPRLDRAALDGFVRFGSVIEPLSLIEGIESLPAGHWMRVDSGHVIETREWWSLDASLAAARDSSRPHPDEIRAELGRAVREHLLSDVPVACFLSGGIDSSAVAMLASRAASSPLRTFTVGFEDVSLDESAIAALVAERCGSRHERLALADAEVAALAPEAVAAMDLPTADGVNTYVVSRAVAHAGVKVVLSGLGGDELFGGYRSFNLLPRAEKWSRLAGLIPAPLRAIALGGGEAGRRAAEMLESGATIQRRYEALRSFWSRPALRAMAINPEVGYHRTTSPSSTHARVSALELTGYMKSTLLRDSDSMSMAHSIELRVPFLDHRLLELCVASRAASPSRDGRPKAALLDALGADLPEQVWKRRKQGFVLPMDRWMRGPLRDFVAEGLDRLAGSGALPGVQLPELRAQFEAGQLPWARLWEFSVLGHWLGRTGMAASR